MPLDTPGRSCPHKCMIPVARLDKRLPIPLYHQLQCALMGAIENGQLTPDQQLPNEGMLAENFGVSKITVCQAMRELVDLGYVRRERGRGTFVHRFRRDAAPRELTSFSEEMRHQRLAAGSRVLERFSTGSAGRVAEALDLPVGEPVFVLKRLRLADGQPMGIQTAHIPLALAPGLAEDNLENVSLYGVLRERYGLQPAKAWETCRAVPAEPIPAELLGVSPGSPLFAVERVTYLPNGQPFEFSRSVMRGDRYRMVLELAASRIAETARERARATGEAGRNWAPASA